jgi:hypothetical protein
MSKPRSFHGINQGTQQKLSISSSLFSPLLLLRLSPFMFPFHHLLTGLLRTNLYVYPGSTCNSLDRAENMPQVSANCLLQPVIS